MKRRLTATLDHIFRQLPVSRAVYAERDALRAKLSATETSDVLSAAAQVAPYDPHSLETYVPVMRTVEERTLIATLCRDADVLPKVDNAGTVVNEPDGTRVQIMHNGIKVIAGGYYGEWMQNLIALCKGHHEPQEEVLFAEILKQMPGQATMLELGGYWSFYSVWFQFQSPERRSIIVEADPAHMEIGRINARLNQCQPVFVPAFVGARSASPAPFSTETSGVIDLPCVTVAEMMDTHGIEHLDLLHCDAQGVELAVIESCLDLAAAGRLGWLMVSTHTHHISGDPLTHQRCLAALRRAGATILAEHDVQESYSGDGLIVARFGAVPATWSTPKLSFNRYSESLFRNPLYDLAAAIAAAAAPVATPASKPDLPIQLDMLANSHGFTLRGGLLALTADGPLGRQGDTLLLPHDEVMFPHVVTNASWSLEIQEFFARHIDPARSYAVLDIGANVGLFTRQMALRFPNLCRFFCIEAEPGNFRALTYNVASVLGERGTLWNVALSDTDGTVRFFRDDDNFGNYSLNDDAMRGRPFDVIEVKAVATSSWMAEHIHVPPDAAIVWKSDTQGYDELIISLTPLDIWSRIDCAVVELWRIKKPSFDRSAFIDRIEAFPNKSIGGDNQATIAEILDFIDGEDWDHSDLYLWR